MELRMTIAALARIGIRPWLRDPHRGVAAPADGASPAKLLRDVAIIHLNASDLPQILATQSAEAAGRLTIGFFPWELKVLPESHRLALELVDEIWVPTACLQRSYAAACDKPVINMGKGIELPAVVPPFPRAALGLAADAFVFMTGFDFHASLERKNPWALVQAFQLAFPDDDGVALLIKTTDEQAEHGSDPYDQGRRLSDAAARDPRIHLMVQQQEFDDVFGLIGMADCVVSAHRAEGFGDLPAFGLLLGKPVIVTDYSGTQEYCSEATSFPVRCSLKPIEPPEFIHAGEGSLWAEIDIAHLAERMRQVRADPRAAAARMAAGQALLRERFSLDALAARYTERLRALGVLE
jgi:glycosyltransferase involved in cell wall biosynthesis